MTTTTETPVPVFAEPELTPAGHSLLDAASELFYARGIRAVGVDLVALEAGTTKKTLYDRFGSKDRLVAQYLTRRGARWQHHVLELVAAQPDPRRRLLTVFDALEEWHAGQDRGCAFVNAYAEVGAGDQATRDVVRQEKDWMRRLFVALAAGAGLSSPETSGASVHLLYEGALVLSTAGGRPSAVTEARATAAALLAPSAPTAE
ncbi:TetR/AcrR family transcriptional regulator [Isoptericola sp. S6320L]|uniref:TetR/AcrR family transcriptional regulator n=1 Tax=Isoptericola sp. S6320L TaxID=2926411 RepID=UPI001FF55496|nr:TetR/AcrR family transcriptional regulator [Isoptericola sp. S6320L]MCK0117765.1 TetR/AcrR family transcriptional regulator [Isoptericola sp. S6320L]